MKKQVFLILVCSFLSFSAMEHGDGDLRKRKVEQPAPVPQVLLDGQPQKFETCSYCGVPIGSLYIVRCDCGHVFCHKCSHGCNRGFGKSRCLICQPRTAKETCCELCMVGTLFGGLGLLAWYSGK